MQGADSIKIASDLPIWNEHGWHTHAGVVVVVAVVLEVAVDVVVNELVVDVAVVVVTVLMLVTVLVLVLVDMVEVAAHLGLE